MMWAALGPIIAAILKALGLGDLLVTDRKTEAVLERPAVVVRPQRAEHVASGRASAAALRGRRGTVGAVLVVAILGPLMGCAVHERTTERVELVPTIIDAGPPLESGAKIATSELMPVVVFGPDGEPVAGAGPTPMNLSGAVVVPPWRWAELMRTEAALLDALGRLDEAGEAAVLAVLGRR